MKLDAKIIVLVAMLASFVAAAPGKALTRAALVTGPGGDSLRPLADLVAAELHGDAGLQLLERQEIQPVLAEHQLSANGMTNPATAVAAGKLLSVDIFAVLDAGPAGNCVVVYDARSGLRLADQLLAAKTADQQATEVAAIFRDSLTKQKAITHPVCLLTVRNADLGSSMDSFCDGIGRILQRQLLTSKDVTILERQYLDEVNKERALPTSRPSMPLLPSLHFLELEISRGKPPRAYSAKVFLTDSQGTPLATVEASADDAGELVRRLLDGVVLKLGAGSPQPPDAVRESMRFASESDFFRSHRQIASALAASEAAYALNPKDRINKQRLAKDLATVASGDCPLATAIDQYDRALNFSIDYEQHDHSEAGMHDGSYFEVDGRLGTFIATHRDGEKGWHRNDPLNTLRLKFREDQIQRVRKWAAHPSGADAHADFATNALCSLIPHLNECAANRGEFVADLNEVVGNLWLGVYEKQPVSKWDYFPESGELKMFVDCIFRGYQPWHEWDFYNHGDPKNFAPLESDLRDYARKVLPLYKKLSGSHDPVISFCGNAGTVWCDALNNGRPLDDLQEPFQAVSKIAEETIHGSMDADARDRIYVVWEMAIDLFFRPDNHLIDSSSKESKQRDKELYVMWDFRKGRQEFPVVEENTKPSQTPWLRADRICDIRARPELKNIDYLVHPLLRDGMVWTTGLGHDGGKRFIQLLAFPIPEGPAKILARLDVAWPNESAPPNVETNSAAALSEDCYYLSSRNIGIIAFPLDGGAASLINTKNGLPTDHVDSIAYLEHSLYAGLGDGGYIVRYDLKQSRCDVLCSSRRKDKKSELDDTLVWDVPCMRADPSRHRIVLASGGIRGGGIWQIDSKGVLWEMYQASGIGIGTWFSELDGDHVIMANTCWIFDMDLRNDRPLVVHKNPFVPIGPKIIPVSKSITPSVTPWPPYLYRDGWLWAGFDFTRINISTEKSQDLPEVSSSVGHERVIPSEVLQSINDGKQALIGSQRTLWLLTFDEAKAATTQP